MTRATTVQRTGGTGTISLGEAMEREVSAALRDGIPPHLVQEAKLATPFSAAPEQFADALHRILARELAAKTPAPVTTGAPRKAPPKAKAPIVPRPTPKPRADEGDDDDGNDGEPVRCAGCGASNDPEAEYCKKCGAALSGDPDADPELAAELAKLDRQVRIMTGDRTARAEASAPQFVTSAAHRANFAPLVLDARPQPRPPHENLSLPQRAARAEHVIRNIDHGLQPLTIDASWFPPDHR
jgi:hypothetical protein